MGKGKPRLARLFAWKFSLQKKKDLIVRLSRQNQSCLFEITKKKKKKKKEIQYCYKIKEKIIIWILKS